MNLKFKIQNSEFRRGFTLIELLIVIAIVGILMALLTVNFVGVRQRSRDAQRKSDLRQIQSALEIYRADQSGYPSTLASCGSAFSYLGRTTYMEKIPCDPQSGASYTYTYDGVTSTYTISGCLENGSDLQIDKDSGNNRVKCSATLWRYSLYNP